MNSIPNVHSMTLPTRLISLVAAMLHEYKLPMVCVHGNQLIFKEGGATQAQVYQLGQHLVEIFGDDTSLWLK
jgi:hypothetical protein